MSKVSITERNNKRWTMSKKYSAKRTALKELSKNKTVSMEERFQAAVKLAKLTKKFSSYKI